jgi:hypothetical protein
MSRVSILEHLEARSIGYRHLDEFDAPDFCTVKYGETGKSRYGLDANQEWCLEATISVTFWANTAQYQHAREIAERALVHRLYADVLRELPELRMQISNGSRMGCLRIVDRIEQTLTEPK